MIEQCQWKSFNPASKPMYQLLKDTTTTCHNFRDLLNGLICYTEVGDATADDHSSVHFRAWQQQLHQNLHRQSPRCDL